MPLPASEDRDLLALVLARTDLPCPVCRYGLRGITSDRCPECGARLDLRIGSIDLRLAPWVTGIVGVTLPLGFAVNMSIIGLVQAFTFGGGTLGEWIFLSSGFGISFFLSVMLLLLIRRRRNFLERSRARQWCSAIGLILFGMVLTAGWVGLLFYV